jgi:hypothetical protein
MNRAPLALVLALFAGVLAASAACPAHAASDGRLSLSGDRVHVYNLAGTVDLVAGTGNAVTVESTHGGRDGGRIDVQTLPGSEPALVFAYPASERRIVYRPKGTGKHGSWRTTFGVDADGRFGDGSGKNGRKVEIRSDGNGFEGWVDLRIAIPAGQKAALHLGVGAVTVTNVDGELRIDCAAGPITAQGTHGLLDIDTGSGEVEIKDASDDVRVDTGSGAVSLLNFTGRIVSIDTGSGSVRLGSVQAADRVEVDTGSGAVEAVDVRSPRVSVDTGSGRVFVRLASNVEELDVDTGSGSVTVEAPTTLNATVHMSTGSGGLDVDFPIKVLHREDDSLEGTIGNGHGRITLGTGSGRIRLTKV